MKAPNDPVTQVIVLVGGKGTRLGDLTLTYPKPLVPIDGDRRFLDYLLAELARQGFTDIVLVSGYLGNQVQERYGGASIGGATVRVLLEAEPRGTGGAIWEAREILEAAFVAMNGDAFLDVNIRAFEREAAALPHRWIAGVLRVADAQRYGTVKLEGATITAFREKDATAARPGLVNAGLYRFERSILDEIRNLPCSLETDVFPELVRRRQLGALPIAGWFIDIGLPESLAEARRELPWRTRRPCAFLDRDGTLNVDDGYTHRPEDLTWVPGAKEAIRFLNDRGYYVVVCTNQAGIAKGYFSEDDMAAFHRAMNEDLAGVGAFIDAFYHCPFHVDAVVERYRADHPDRKPNPGLLLRAMQDRYIDRSRSFMIGDRPADVAAGEAAGVRSYLYTDGSLDSLVRAAFDEAHRSDTGGPH